MPADQERALTAVLCAELALVRAEASLKATLRRGYDYSAAACFDTLDAYRTGRVTEGAMRCFMRYSTDAEIVAAIRRIDLDGDQALSFYEFNQFVSSGAPVSVPVRAEPASAEKSQSLRAMSPVRPAKEEKRPQSAPRRAEPVSEVVRVDPPCWPLYSRYYPYYYSSSYYRDYYLRYGYYPADYYSPYPYSSVYARDYYTRYGYYPRDYLLPSRYYPYYY